MTLTKRKQKKNVTFVFFSVNSKLRYKKRKSVKTIREKSWLPFSRKCYSLMWNKARLDFKPVLLQRLYLTYYTFCFCRMIGLSFEGLGESRIRVLVRMYLWLFSVFFTVSYSTDLIRLFKDAHTAEKLNKSNKGNNHLR